jgi:murein DD-endopeptidase MepM/ murein hydrolase activator NlpD
VVAGDQGDSVWVENTLAGPIEVLVSAARADNLAADPALPARATVPAHGQVLVSRLHPATAGQPWQYRLQMHGVPGAPGMSARDVPYRLPLALAVWRISQGPGGPTHASDDSRFAMDFPAPPGTPVLAARAGVVMQLADQWPDDGSPGERLDHANFVRVLHDDGSMALYAHLARNGVRVRPGQRVGGGEVLGLSGNSGFSRGPHLHFVVQVNRGMQLVSVPFRLLAPTPAD